MSEPAEPPRPLPARAWRNEIAAWLGWMGVARLAIAACSTLVIVLGLWWLVRAPTPPVEQSLGFADSSSPAATLPEPSPVTTVPPSTVPQLVIVHVAGEVHQPGVYTLNGTDRVDDAIARAGGLTNDAAPDSLNLAAPLVDGQRVYVPPLGAVDPATVSNFVDQPAGTGAQAVDVGPINLNTALETELETLPGIGPATAAAIVEDRSRRGPFASVADLARVTGIGPAKLAALEGLVVT